MSPRSTIDVINSHLELRRRGQLAEDLEQNYSDDIVVLSHLGQFRGLEGMKTVAHLLAEQLKDAVFRYRMVLFDREYAFLQWTAEASDLHVSHGADSFCVREGRIVLQTIYYSIATNMDQGGVVQDS